MHFSLAGCGLALYALNRTDVSPAILFLSTLTTERVLHACACTSFKKYSVSQLECDQDGEYSSDWKIGGQLDLSFSYPAI
jgi:hypothetical protein